MPEGSGHATPDSPRPREPLHGDAAPAPPPPLPDGVIGWTALLGRWVEFARAAVAFPRDATGARWRASVAPAIGLQAVTFALAEIDRVAPDERPSALDRAELLVRKHTAELSGVWRGETLHPELVALANDARRALEAARGAGAEWIVVDDRLTAPDLSAVCSRLAGAHRDAEAIVAAPGTLLFRGSPLAYFRPAPIDAPPPGAAVRGAAAARQVYRQIDDTTGRAVRDLVAPLAAGLPAGRPLLTPVVENGRIVATLDRDAADRWTRDQLRAIGDSALPVVFADGGD